jgi:sugar fermentation stimulation protein A
MEFEPGLIEGRLIRRWKRFFAEVELAGGERVVAHCANPGAMRNCMPEGAPVWLSESARPARSLRFTWELVEADGALVCVNTARANRVVVEAIAAGQVAALAGWPGLAREVRCGRHSRVDLLLTRGAARCWVEVKSATMGCGGGVTAFPDSVTERGTRHLELLLRRVRLGERAALLFCCARADTRALRPADEIDPRYGRTLRRAARAGVQVLAHRCEVTPRGLWLREAVPIDLAPLARRA